MGLHDDLMRLNTDLMLWLNDDFMVYCLKI